MATKQYPNLPGLILELKDGGLTVTTDEALTRSVLVFGKALWGPVNEPVSVGSPSEGEQLFGSVIDSTGELTGTQSLTIYTQNQAALQMWEAFAAGCTDVRVVRLGLDGVTAYLDLTLSTSTPSDYLRVSAAYPGYIGNSFSVATAFDGEGTSTHLRIKLPTFLGGGVYQFDLADYTTMGDLIDDVNRILDGFVVLSLVGSTETTMLPTFLPALESDTSDTYRAMASAINLGTDVATPTDYDGVAGTNDTTPTLTSVYTALGDPAAEPGDTPTALQNLRDYKVDIIANSVYYVDEITGSSDDLVQRLVDFCHLQHLSGYTTTAIMGVSLLATNPTRTQIRARRTALLDAASYPGILMETGIASTSGFSDVQNAGRYFQIVAGPQCSAVIRNLGIISTNGAVHAAGMRSTLPWHEPMTFDGIPGLKSVLYDFSNNEKNDLVAGVGAVTDKGGSYLVLENRDGEVQPINSASCAKRNTDYQETYVLDICNSVSQIIHDISRRYLGSSFSFAHRNALKNEITAAMDELGRSGAIVGEEGLGYEFTVRQSNNDRVRGQLFIDMALRPALELRYIYLTISVQS
jgi:hypothetical protein